MELDQTLYELLDVDERATSSEIATAFRRLAKRWHPDRNAAAASQATERMKRISAAYEVLRDPERRAEYDDSLRPAASDAARSQAGTEPDRGDAAESSWWGEPAREPASAVIADPTAPDSYFICRSRFATVAGAVGHRWRPEAWASSHAASPEHLLLRASSRLIAVLCPCVSFLLAAWSARNVQWAAWGVLYACAPLLWIFGAVTAGPVAVRAGQTLWIIGIVHRLRWRTRLDAAVGFGGLFDAG
jgi:DnaJ domain